VILAAPTPAAWVDAACVHWRELLVDHANCEKKAASSALALIFAYPEDQELCPALSRLAREELRHFEQVLQMMRRLQVGFERQRPGRYAAGLRAALRPHEPARKLDLMLAGALIEARSSERFALLAPRLPQPLGAFYAGLQQAEARHFELYLRLAQRAGGDGDAAAVQSRLRALAAVEAELICASDEQLRFHSGPPPARLPQQRAAISAAAPLKRTAEPCRAPVPPA
jgi:tRNA 2-(methylsulfanyl)-N6-isopentenyladenosine37 hydroxylase